MSDTRPVPVGEDGKTDTQQVSVGGEDGKIDAQQVSVAEGGTEPESAEEQKERPGAATSPLPAKNQPSSTRRQKFHRAMTTRIVLPWWTAYALAAVAPCVLVYGFVSRWGAGQWGDVATWLSGFSTLAAVLVALWQTQISREAAAKATQEADDAKKQAVLDSGAAKKDADDRLGREIDAYRERVEAQLKKSDELHDRRTRAEALAVQRSELMLFWPVLDETQWAAIKLPRATGLSEDDLDEWTNRAAKLKLAHSRAKLFLYDTEVLDAIEGVVGAIESYTRYVRAVARGEVTFSSPDEVDSAKTDHLQAIKSMRIPLRDKVSARMTEFAPESVMKRSDGWASASTTDEPSPEDNSRL